MSKIESVPSPTRAGVFLFYVDADGHATEPAVQATIAELSAHASWVQVLGTYPEGDTVH